MRSKQELMDEYTDKRIDPKDKIRKNIEMEVLIDIRDNLMGIQMELDAIKNTMYNGISTYDRN